MCKKIIKRFSQSCGNNSYHYLIAGLLVFGLAMRLLGLDKGMWLDEYSSIRFIFTKRLIHELRLYDHPPFYFILLKLWSLISIKEPFLRILSVIFGFGTLAIMIRWLTQYSRHAGILGGLIVAVHPLMLRYSQEIRNYPVLLFAVALSFYFAFNLTGTPVRLRHYFGLAGSLTVVVMTHLTGIMVVPAIMIYYILSVKEYQKIQLLKTALTVTIPCLVFMVIYFFFLYHIPDKTDWWMPPVSGQLILSILYRSSGMKFLMRASRVLQNNLPVLIEVYKYCIICLVTGVGICLAFFGKWRSGIPLFAAVSVYWLQLLVYSLLVTPIFWYRTVLPGLIPLFGFVAVQTAGIQRKKIKKISIMCIITVSIIFAAGWTGKKAWQPNGPLKQVSEYLKFNRTENDVVIFYPDYIEGAILYYFPELPPTASLAVKRDINVEELDLESFNVGNTLTEGNKFSRIFFIVDHALIRDHGLETYTDLSSRLTREYGQPSFEKEFNFVSVTEYEF